MDPLSGTASVIAVVSFAAQLATGLKELVDFWKRVQKAPADIRALFDDLESLLLVLGEAKLSNGEELDPITAVVLKDCQKKVGLLCDKVSVNACGLDSSTFKRRKWSAFRISLDQGEIESLRRTIEKSQTTLILAKIISIERSNFAQRKILQHMSELIRIQQVSKATHCIDSANRNMQILEGDSRFIIDIKTPGSKISSGNSPLVDSPRPVIPRTLEIPLQHASYHKFQEVECRRQKMQTPLGYYTAWSTTRRAIGHRPKESLYPEEQETVYALYPSRFLAKLGVSYGLLIQARCIDGWQYNIQPFNAVPDDALIFTFCSEGNVAAVKNLLTSGKASLRDRDSRGQTALWYATQSLQLGTTLFLLQQGADIHATDWMFKRSAILALILGPEPDATKRLSMLRLFQQYSSNDFDEGTIRHLVGLVLHFYRPGREFRFVPFSTTEREEFALNMLQILFPIWDPSNDILTILIHDMFLFEYRPMLLHWTLGKVESMLAESDECSVIHVAVADKLPIKCSRTMKLVIDKTSDLHRVSYSVNVPRLKNTTPTSLAMYQAGLFFAWRDALVEAGEDIPKFVEEELSKQSSPLAEEGWTATSLLALFNLDQRSFPNYDFEQSMFQLRCERCGCWERSRDMMVDLQWRWFLQQIREGSSLVSPTIDSRGPITFLQANGFATSQDGREFQGAGNTSSVSRSPETDGYRTVCSRECLDGIRLAWTFEHDTKNSSDERSGSELASSIGSALSAGSLDGSSDDCPTNTMPGAFVF